MDKYVLMQKRRAEYKKLRKTAVMRHQRILEIYFSGRTGSVLDFGVGEGSFNPPAGIKYCGYDIDRENPKASYTSLSQMKDMKFDYIVLSHVIEHMQLDEVLSTLRWARSHARKEVIIATPNSNLKYISKFWTDITHVRPYSSFDLLALMEDEGFRIKSVYYCDLPHRSNPVKALFQTFLAWMMDNHPFVEFMIFAEVK